MAKESTRTINLVFTGEIVANNSYAAASNLSSPSQIETRTLAAGNITITPPTGGSTPTAVTIVPPAGNTQTLVLKGVAGDTGISLHKTDPTTLGLFSPTGTFVLTAGGTITGLLLIWS